MKSVNLLPESLLTKGPTARLSQNLKNISLIGFILLIFLIIAGGGYLFFLSDEVKRADQTNEALKTSIRSLEETELKVVLIKDRVKKAGEVLAKESAHGTAQNLKILSTVIPDITNLTEAKLAKDLMESSFILTSSSSVAELLASVISLELYNKVQLKAFGFNPLAGYIISLELYQ